ncbi:MAG: hypothetical protein PGN27_06580 [Mycolicibacterium neoaurum]
MSTFRASAFRVSAFPAWRAAVHPVRWLAALRARLWVARPLR